MGSVLDEVTSLYPFYNSNNKHVQFKILEKPRNQRCLVFHPLSPPESFAIRIGTPCIHGKTQTDGDKCQVEVLS